MEILAEKIPPRQGRTNPRVVKKLPPQSSPAKTASVDSNWNRVSFSISNTASVRITLRQVGSQQVADTRKMNTD